MRRSPLLWATTVTLGIGCALGLGGLAGLGCLGGSSTGGSANYRGAAVGAAFGVAAAGVNRAITGDCWAACLPGTYCDHKSGLCKKLERPEDIPAPYPTVPHATDKPPIEPEPVTTPVDLDAGVDAADSGDGAPRE